MGKSTQNAVSQPVYDIGLPEFDVIKKQVSPAGDYLYTVVPNERPTECPVCGGLLHVHKSSQRKIKDLDEFGHRVGIVVDGKSYRCKDCGNTHRVEYPSITGQMTTRLVAAISADAFSGMTFTDVARKYNVSVSTVEELFREQGESFWAEYHFVTPKVLGIDEVHLNNAYYGVFVKVDKADGCIIEISEERTKKAVIEVLKRMEHPENLQYVTMDMWKPYRDAVRTVFPDTPVVIDHFHVTKELQKSLDAIRTTICKTIKSKKDRISLKHNRFLMLAASESLSPAQQHALNKLLENYPAFDAPYQLKESFRNIYEFAKTKEEALQMYEEWCQECVNANVSAYEGFIQTVDRWKDEIFAYFDYIGDDRTNAQTESFNRVIRDVARAGRGYSYANLRTKLVFRKDPSAPKSTRFDFSAFNNADDD